MIKFEHNGFQVSCQGACYRGYDGVDVMKWNPKVKPFVAHWIIQKEEDVHMLRAIEDCMLLWNVTKKWSVIVNSC